MNFKNFSVVFALFLLLPLIYASNVTSDYKGCWQLDAENLSDSYIGGYTFTNYSTVYKAVDIVSINVANGLEMLLKTNKAEFIKDEKNI
jgi:hypothetical protein